MKRPGMILATAILLSGTLLNAGTGDVFRAAGFAHFFQPSDTFFRDIYGGGAVFGGEIGLRLWKGLSLWAAADIYNKTGVTTFSEEKTELRIIPVFGGLMFEFARTSLRPYLGIGIGYFQYREINPIGKIEDGDLGYIVQAGVRFKAAGPLYFDAKGGYSLCKSASAQIEAELGGFRAGLGIGLEF